jgi:DNA invertase Pin-like site-specific DNA recombinase
MRRAYSYIRFSSKDQAKGDSLRRQTAGTQARCDREGWLLDDGLVLTDIGVSAFRGKNAAVGALAGFLKAVQIGRVAAGSVLIIENLDRLSREELDLAEELVKKILKAGMDIVTLAPDRHYTRDSLNNPFCVFEMLMHLYLAHEESAKKSFRSKENWKAKRAAMSKKPVLDKCPAWFRPTQDRSGFEAVPEAADTIRLIYQMAREGQPTRAITASLNQRSVPPVGGKAGRWSHAYVTKILSSRTVIGEKQPHVMQDGKPVAEGPPISNYYPAIISEAEWHATRGAVERRRNQRGPRGKRIRNLFTGLLFDARDGKTMHVASGGSNQESPYLVSSGARYGEQGSTYLSMPYETLEGWILRWLRKDLVDDLLRQGPDEHDAQITELTGKLTDLDWRLSQTRQRIKTARHPEPLYILLDELAEEQKVASAALERLKQEQSCHHAETLGEARSISALLREAGPDELLDLRTRLKGQLRALVREIWVLIDGPRGGRWATVQIHFRRGTWSQFTATMGVNCALQGPGGPEELLPGERDLRKWRTLKKKPTFGPNAGMVWSIAGQERLRQAAARKDVTGG